MLETKMNASDTVLQRYRSRESRRSSATRRVASDDADVATDDAYDVTHYFADDFADPWREGDALERERLSQHARLRELVSRGDVAQLRAALAALGSNADLVVNLTPGAANTLLYTACEAGLTSVVGVLLEAGADGRAHPVTKYSPLYVACYQGHLEIAKMLLAHFPRAVQQETVEKWLPLHAACIGGHAALVTLLLDYPYPQDMLRTYTIEHLG